MSSRRSGARRGLVDYDDDGGDVGGGAGGLAVSEGASGSALVDDGIWAPGCRFRADGGRPVIARFVPADGALAGGYREASLSVAASTCHAGVPTPGCAVVTAVTPSTREAMFPSPKTAAGQRAAAVPPSTVGAAGGARGRRGSGSRSATRLSALSQSLFASPPARGGSRSGDGSSGGGEFSRVASAAATAAAPAHAAKRGRDREDGCAAASAPAPSKRGAYTLAAHSRREWLRAS